MKKLLLLLSVTFLVACKKDSNPVPLSVSQNKVELNSLGGQMDVQVSVSDFSVKTSTDWVTTNSKGNTLTISAEQNSQSEVRKAEISVSSGDEKVSITVVQSGSVLSVSLSENEINISSKAGDYQFNVQSNTNQFEARPNDSWITVKDRENNSNLISFSVEANPEKTNRQGSISILINNQEQVVFTVNQKGNLNFVLPSFAFGSTTEELTKTEDKRFTRISAQDTGTGTLLKYSVTNDDIFDQISYLVNLNAYVKSSLYVRGGTISEQDKENFENFLLENGFKKITEKGTNTSLDRALIDKTVFVSDEKEAKIEFMADNRYNHYTMTYRAHQSQNYPTVTALPELEKGLTKEQVTEKETQKGGTLNSNVSIYNRGKEGNHSDFLFFDVNENHLIGRGYYVYYPNQTKTGLTQVSYFYDIAELALWRGLDGKYYPTQEFIEFAKSQGFIQYGKASNGNWLFKNVSLLQNMTIEWTKHQTLGWVLRINVY